MKLTKIESYEIQAFAFRVMTGYMAPGKDVSPLACEAPYEERCAAWDEWRNKHAHCILAMLHGFEALIDRDDEPTRALLDRLDAAEREAALRAEVEALKADLSTYMQAANEHLADAEALRAENHNLNWALGTEGYAQMATPEEQAENDKAVQNAEEAIARLERAKTEYEAMKVDAACFRFWVREAACAPGDMARLIANCLTEQDYRDAIMPVALAAEAAIDAARGKE